MIELTAKKELHADGAIFNLDLELAIEKGEHAGIIGSSGAGKTSLLRIMAGLIKPDSGRLIVDGETWFDANRNINLPTQERDIGFVFQDYALFPNMSARENLEFAFSSTVNKKRVEEVMEMLAISDVANQRPGTLSGGQKQRVALGRALIRDPNLLLLDEPLSSLDPEIRKKLQQYLSVVASNFDGTMILVSHDATEIIQLTDRAFILEKGEIVQQGTPAEILLSQSGNSHQPGKVEVIEILSDKKIAIVKSHHGVLHLPFDADDELKIGDTICLKI